MTIQQKYDAIIKMLKDGNVHDEVINFFNRPNSNYPTLKDELMSCLGEWEMSVLDTYADIMTDYYDGTNQ